MYENKNDGKPYQRDDGEIIHDHTRRIYALKMFFQTISPYDVREGYKLKLIHMLLQDYSTKMMNGQLFTLPEYTYKKDRLPIMVIHMPMIYTELIIDYFPGMEYHNNATGDRMIQLYQRYTPLDIMYKHNIYTKAFIVDYYPFSTRYDTRNINCKRYFNNLSTSIDFDVKDIQKVIGYGYELSYFVQGLGDYIFFGKKKEKGQNFFEKQFKK